MGQLSLLIAAGPEPSSRRSRHSKRAVETRRPRTDAALAPPGPDMTSVLHGYRHHARLKSDTLACSFISVP